MSSPRPPARDQPSPEQTERLRAELVATAAERTRLNSAAAIARGPGARRVHVLLDDPRPGEATLVLVDLGQVLTERTVGSRWLLEQLGAAPRFDDLARLLEQDPGHA